MTKENFVQLEGCAVVAFQEYGDANGVPVVFCHGWPSSCTMAQLTDEPARELGVRIISPDRPGISGSSLQHDRKLTDWPHIVQGVIDHLGIGEFRMLAISGGAPYAYATAATMPDRVRAIAIVAGADSHGRTRRCQWVAATLPLDAGALSIATATLAKIVLYGAADSCIAASCPPSAVTFEDANVATMRCGKSAGCSGLRSHL